MKLILQFLKPHWKLTVLTVLLAVIDVGGSLFIPTLAAHLLNQGTSGVAFEELLTTGLQMGAVSLFSSICASWAATPAPPLPPASARTCASRSMKNRSNFRSTIFVSSEPLRSQPEPFRTSPPSSLLSPASSRWCCRYRWSASSPWRCPSS